MYKKYIITTLFIIITLCGCASNDNDATIYNHSDTFVALEKIEDEATKDTDVVDRVADETPVQPKITADEELGIYEQKEAETIFKENIDNNKDMSNSGVDMEESAREFNERQARAEENKFDSLANFEWSFVDENYTVPDEVKNTGDEYDRVSYYVLQQSMKYFDTEKYYEVSSDIQQLSFNYYTDGRNANYIVYYSYDTPGIYVYAYVE